MPLEISSKEICFEQACAITKEYARSAQSSPPDIIVKLLGETYAKLKELMVDATQGS